MPLPALVAADQTRRAGKVPSGSACDNRSLTPRSIAGAITLGLFWPELARITCTVMVLASGGTAP